jgi:hypothetical protein
VSQPYDFRNGQPVPTGRWSCTRRIERLEQYFGNMSAYLRRIVGPTFENRDRVKILIDGVDVAKRCFYFDEGSGIVGLYALNDQGRLYGDANGAVEEWLVGKVELVIEKEARSDTA